MDKENSGSNRRGQSRRQNGTRIGEGDGKEKEEPARRGNSKRGDSTGSWKKEMDMFKQHKEEKMGGRDGMGRQRARWIGKRANGNGRYQTRQLDGNLVEGNGQVKAAPEVDDKQVRDVT